MMAGTEMLRIADMAKIEIRVDVGESDIPKVQLGDSAVITVDAYNDRKFKGLVTQIASSNNGAATQTALTNTSTDVTNYKVYIRLLPESYADLTNRGSYPFRPGMSASADIQTKTHTNVISVPINAVTTRDKNENAKGDKKPDDASNKSTGPTEEPDVVVFLLQPDNTVKKVKVKTAIQDINYIEVTDGIKENDMVITGPYEAVSKLLKEKDIVKVVEKKDLFDKK
jgi:HlyD family secretion protein